MGLGRAPVPHEPPQRAGVPGEEQEEEQAEEVLFCCRPWWLVLVLVCGSGRIAAVGGCCACVRGRLID